MQFILALAALSFLIIVHEIGHFLAAKLSGIKVLEFAIFMGPKLFTKKIGETAYTLRAVPIGGFVKMEGEEESSEDSRAYNKKPIYIRAAVIAAGPVMNLIAAIIIITFLSLSAGYGTTKINSVDRDSPAYKAGLQKGDEVVRYDGKKVFQFFDVFLFLNALKGETAKIEVKREGSRLVKEIEPLKIPAQNNYRLGFTPYEGEGKDSNLVKNVNKGLPGDKAGVKAMDRIIKINGTVVESRMDIASKLNENKNNPVVLTVIRNGKEISLLQTTPKLVKDPEQYYIGIEFQNEHGNIIRSAGHAVNYTISITRSMYYTIIWLATGTVSVAELMGPVGIVTTIGDVVQQSQTAIDKLMGLLSITALISINLGIFNLIPFPALDGSKLIILGIEGIRKKAMPPEKEAYITMVGLVLLIMLMIFVTYNDILRRIARG